MDVDMPRLSGLAVTELLRKHLPHIKVLIITMHSKSEFVMRMIRAGASGYVLKQSPVEELIRAIEAVSSGQSFFSPELARVALNRFVQGGSEGDALSVLTCREREVLIQIAEGYSNKEIANQLGVGVRTIETHRERVMRKLQIHSIAGLTRFAISHGLVALQAPYPMPN
jgi:DNA-binding NarL/FixJ family response regulator